MRLPYKYSDISCKMFYSTISAEILGICRATSSYNDFLSSVHKLISRAKKPGAEINNIIKALRKMIFRHTEDFKIQCQTRRYYWILLEALLLKFHVAEV